MNDQLAEEIVRSILSVHSVQTAVALGDDSRPYVRALRDRGIEVTSCGDAESLALRDDNRCDLCICIGYCDGLSVEKSDDWIDFLSENSSLTLFQSGVPSKHRPDVITDQVEDYWISMFELRGCVAVKGFGNPGHMPILFSSRTAIAASADLRATAEPATFFWRKRFEGQSIEHRTSAPVTQVGPNTSGQTRKIAAAVITYKPAAAQLGQVRDLANMMDCVIVADNSEPALEPIPGTEWVPMGGNKGIAAALNAACKRAKDMRYEWLLTLDQDAEIKKESLDTYLGAFNRYNDKDGTAIVAPRNHGKDLPADKGDIQDLEMVITSGSLTNLAIWEKLGGFTDELFIDEVDHDYCLRARSRGYRVVKLLDAQLTHQAGRLMTVLTLRGRPAIASSHPPIRLYYMARNYFFMKRRYNKTYPNIIAFQRQHLIGKFKEYLLYHHNRWPSVFAMIKGSFHGLMGRFGK